MSNWQRANTDWMRGRWGMMTHFLADLADLEGTGVSVEEFWRAWESRGMRG